MIARPPACRRIDTLRLVIVCACMASAACGSPAPTLPSEGGTPFPDVGGAYAAATAQCRGVRTLSAELALSGRAGGSSLRGRILGGFADPGKVRLEAPAPFGRPVFTLVIDGSTATLVLNRERRVVRGAPPAALVEALAGVPLGPDALRAVIAGCGFTADQVTAGESYPGGWLTGQDGETRIWLRRVDDAWRLAASARGGVEVRYEEFAAGRPSLIRLRQPAATATAETNLALRLSQVDINVPLEDKVFVVEVPDDTTPLSLEELRRSGPLGAPGAGAPPPPGAAPR